VIGAMTEMMRRWIWAVEADVLTVPKGVIYCIAPPARLSLRSRICVADHHHIFSNHDT